VQGSIILTNHRAGPVSIRPVKLAGSLTWNASVVSIHPLRGRPAFFLPRRCELSITPSPDLTLASPVDELIIFNMQIADCVLVCVSSRPRNRIGPGRAFQSLGRAGPVFFCSVPGQAEPFSAGPGLIFSASAQL